LTDFACFRDNKGLWTVRNLTGIYFGVATDEPVPADYDGDGSADFGYWRAAGLLWKVKGITRVYFGLSDDSQIANPW